ncbi:Aldo-keto reductase family 1 member [Wickerhamomyces ciferrii]|uniref:Aldo-keto reductase family 1 member n=1 Tax=Wickerhamomyces ciferrii (strain ATCC 14091 / BCRC 22168 / CBS 111 / JCM 3599 / NBRC 0793 / NRRL Y-1031 F-60-10) TaxID=1206466 RepID=K0KHY2_WICCF|nr:Aldo-keto reductase family 1 member [Wickerhamomyces ciferrii]CCH41757.1 Aldo-keto reductase family 1 member [Wickerhamomyces ciferrii]
MSLKPDSTYTLNNGQTIPVSGFGVYQIPLDQTQNLVYEALKVGYRHIDSAQGYGNEEQAAKGIAQFLQENPDVRRSDVFFTTKILHTNHGYERSKVVIDESLAKVVPHIEYIDLFLLHSPKSTKQLRIETWKRLQEYVDAGVVKSLGVSNFGIKHLEEFYAWVGLKYKPVVNQLELHPWLPRLDLLEHGKQNDYYLEAYGPLTQNKKIDDPELVKVAQDNGLTPAQVLLRWSYDQGYIPLAKTANVKRLPDNFSVLEKVPPIKELKGSEVLNKPDSYLTLDWDPTVYDDSEYVQEK